MAYAVLLNSKSHFIHIYTWVRANSIRFFFWSETIKINEEYKKLKLKCQNWFVIHKFLNGTTINSGIGWKLHEKKNQFVHKRYIN